MVGRRYRVAMQVLRTPDDRFAGLPDYPFEPHYVDVTSRDGATVRMHYLDEGPRDAAEVVVLLHGEPTWSYLYRHRIGVFTSAGHRVLVPDLIGFGKSDKPAEASDYTYERHTDWVTSWWDQLDLPPVTMFVQDWGSLIGLRIAGLEPERFARICVGNGFLPTADRPMPAAFRLWRSFARFTPVFPSGRIVQVGTTTKRSKAELKAYDAPYPSSRYQAGARRFPALVPTDPENVAVPTNREAWAGLGRFDKPFLTLFGAGDPILGKADRPLQKHVPGAEGQPHDRVRGGHFVQEDAGVEIAERMVAWMAATGS